MKEQIKHPEGTIKIELDETGVNFKWDGDLAVDSDDIHVVPCICEDGSYLIKLKVGLVKGSDDSDEKEEEEEEEEDGKDSSSIAAVADLLESLINRLKHYK